MTRDRFGVRRLFATRRRRTMVIGALVAVVLLVVAGGVTVAVMPAPLARVLGIHDTQVDHACVPATPQNPLGVAAGSGLTTLSDADLARTLDMTAEGGMRWIRFDVPWSSVEATRGQYDWAATDRVVDAARARGLTILGIVDTTPTWARLPGALDKEFSLPNDTAAFGNFAGLAARRYADRITAWEVWNEPNIVNFAAPAPDVAVYGRMLSAASIAIRTNAAPGVTIVTAGLSPAVDGGGNIAPTRFLSTLYRVADSASWDAVGIHPYSYPYLPLDSSSKSFNAFAQLPALYATMRRNGDGAKKLWVTEYGAPTGGTSKQRVSEQFQADSLWSAIMSTRSRGHFGPFFVYSLRDAGTDTSDVEDNFGLLRNDFSPKKAYGAVRATADCR
ncbi:MAG: beta-xylosidase [Corynebacteriales bacterium]|nr:beta-xylosidase [Mycobacteriales bacterium]